MRKALSVLAALALGVAGFTAPAQAAPAPAVPIAATAAAPSSGSELPKLIPDRKGNVRQGNISALATSYYQYARGVFDVPGSTGATWDMTVQSPWMSSLEDHTLAQISVCKDGTSADCVEFGWIKSQFASACPSGNSVPCLFAGARVGNVWQGYNSASPYVDNPSNTTIYRGISLNGAVGGQRNFRVSHNAAQSRWEFIYGTGLNGSTWNDVVGWIPDSAWGGNFTTAGTIQFFTEISSANRVQSAQCTDAGTNVLPTSTAGFQFYDIDVYGVTGETMSLNDVVPSGLTGRASVKRSDTDFAAGGPGSC
jgi:hypothetical protein